MKPLLLASLLLLVAAAPAQAAPDPAAVYQKVASAANPRAAAERLTSAEMRALKTYLTPAKVTKAAMKFSARRSSLLSGGCDRSGHVVRAANVFNVTLWTFTMYAEWCMNFTRTVFTDTYSRSYGNVEALFWQYKPLTHEKWIVTATYPDRFRSFGQAEMKLCLVGDIGCVKHQYPWIDMTVWGIGNSYERWSAGSN
jgi:hypothetical protein